MACPGDGTVRASVAACAVDRAVDLGYDHLPEAALGAVGHAGPVDAAPGAWFASASIICSRVYQMMIICKVLDRW